MEFSMIARRAAALLIAQTLVFPALAQAPAPAPKPAAPVGAEPQTTTATYGDWVLRCQRVGDTANKICELSLTIQGGQGQQQTPVAEIALGRAGKTDPFRMIAHLPTNISLPSVVKFAAGEKDAHPQEMTWRRCVPAGCFADLTLTDAQWKGLHGQTEPGSVEFTDSAGRAVKFPISFRGLPQAMDALAKE
jgi:invasion protein IalB